MAIEGPLRELSLEDVLQLLEMARKTGVLTLRSELLRDRAEVHFEDGVIVFAHRQRSTHRLGQQLLRAGRITERELERALEVQRQDPDQRLGGVLLELGSVERETLESQLRFQLEETMYDLMGWTEGRFRFDEDAELARVPVAIAVRVESLLMEGARRIDEWTRLEPKVPNAEVVPVLAPDDEAGSGTLDLRPEEWEVLAEIDGERELREIAALLGRSSFDVAKIVYGLVNTGVVEVQDEPQRLPETAIDSAVDELSWLLRAGDADAAVDRAAELHAVNPDRPDIAVLYGSALRAKGRLRAATEAFARAVELDPLGEDGHYRLGFTAARIGEFERAARAWRTFLQLSPDDGRADVARRALAAIETLDDALQHEPHGVPA